MRSSSRNGFGLYYKTNPGLTRDYKNYVAGGSWKCEQSPTGAHFWSVKVGTMTCRFCDEVKGVGFGDSIVVHCSGSVKEGVGIWAFSVRYKGNFKERFGIETGTSKNRVQLISCIAALETLKGSHALIDVYSDSNYLVDHMNNDNEVPVGDKDLWNVLTELVHEKGIRRVSFRKTTSHVEAK